MKRFAHGFKRFYHFEAKILLNIKYKKSGYIEDGVAAGKCGFTTPIIYTPQKLQVSIDESHDVPSQIPSPNKSS